MNRAANPGGDRLAELRAQVHRALGSAAATDLVERLVVFTRLVRDWNSRGNLVSNRDAERLLSRHVPESLEFVEQVHRYRPRSILDLGSGAGFPGIPIALALPESLVVLLDSRRMKSLFLLRAIRELQLENCYAWCARAETLAAHVVSRARTDRGSDSSAPDVPTQPPAEWSRLGVEPPQVIPAFDIVTARAVAPLVELTRLAGPLLVSGGRLVAAKGSSLEEEIGELERDPGPWKVESMNLVARDFPTIAVLRRG